MGPQEVAGGSGLSLSADAAENWGPQPSVPDVALKADYGFAGSNVQLGSNFADEGLTDGANAPSWADADAASSPGLPDIDMAVPPLMPGWSQQDTDRYQQLVSALGNPRQIDRSRDVLVAMNDVDDSVQPEVPADADATPVGRTPPYMPGVGYADDDNRFVVTVWGSRRLSDEEMASLEGSGIAQRSSGLKEQVEAVQDVVRPKYPAASLGFSKNGADWLKDVEKLRLKPYDDQTGKDINKWVPGATIGYGKLIQKNEWNIYKEGITRACYALWPCLALPCLALPCLALPCLALPRLALPWR
jgi:hypothetical protein